MTDEYVSPCITQKELKVLIALTRDALQALKNGELAQSVDKVTMKRELTALQCKLVANQVSK